MGLRFSGSDREVKLRKDGGDTGWGAVEGPKEPVYLLVDGSGRGKWNGGGGL